MTALITRPMLMNASPISKPIWLKYGSPKIAAMIGSAREVVSRRLDALEKRGLLRLDRGLVHIQDAASLAHIAESV